MLLDSLVCIVGYCILESPWGSIIQETSTTISCLGTIMAKRKQATKCKGFTWKEMRKSHNEAWMDRAKKK